MLSFNKNLKWIESWIYEKNKFKSFLFIEILPSWSMHLLPFYPLTLLQNTECNICLNKTEYFRSKTGYSRSRSKTKLSSTRLVGLKIVLKLRNLEISFSVAESKSIVISSLNFQTCTKITNMLFMSRTLLLHFSILT